MQNKVSLVMPCYNKVEYIGNMLDSILAQDWDHVELILVNDGSTDGTRDVIGQYEQKIYERGFALKIIDQENAGVCAAAKAGLEVVTGEYFAFIDSDDELDPRYISAMASTLDNHEALDFVVCHRVAFNESKASREYIAYPLQNYTENDDNLLEKYLMWDICRVVWVYMVRTSYIKQCKIAQNYHTSTRGSHEPSYVIPLLAHQGRYKIIPDVLYKFNESRTEGHSAFVDSNQIKSFFECYLLMCIDAIDKLDCKSEQEKKRLKRIAEIAMALSVIDRIRDLQVYDDEVEREIRKLIDEILAFTNNTEYFDAQYSNEFMIAVRKVILAPKKVKAVSTISFRRIIGYGALGKNANKYLPLFQKSSYEPTELWDVRACSRDVQKPDFKSLRSDDAIIVFPSNDQIYCEVKKYAGTARVFRIHDVLTDVIISKYNLSEVQK